MSHIVGSEHFLIKTVSGKKRRCLYGVKMLDIPACLIVFWERGMLIFRGGNLILLPKICFWASSTLHTQATLGNQGQGQNPVHRQNDSAYRISAVVQNEQLLLAGSDANFHFGANSLQSARFPNTDRTPRPMETLLTSWRDGKKIFGDFAYMLVLLCQVSLWRVAQPLRGRSCRRISRATRLNALRAKRFYRVAVQVL